MAAFFVADLFTQYILKNPLLCIALLRLQEKNNNNDNK